MYIIVKELKIKKSKIPGDLVLFNKESMVFTVDLGASRT